MKRKIKVNSTQIELLKKLSICLIQCITCFIAPMSKLLGFTSPFSISVLATSGTNSIWCYLSALLGLWVTGNIRKSVFYIASLTFVMGVKIIFMLDNRKETYLCSTAITFASMITSLFMITVIYGLEYSEIVFYLFCSLLCSLVVYLILSVASRASVDGILDINGMNGASLGVLYVTFVSVFTGVSFLGLNLGRILCVCVVLCGAKKYKHVGGAVCGALSTCGIFLSIPELSGNTMLLATAGLIAGAFCSGGSFIICMVFLICTITGLAVGDINPDTFAMLKDVGIGCVIFACLPRNFVNKISEFVGGEANAVTVVGHAASSKLNFASNTLGSIREQISDISKIITSKSRIQSIQERVENSSCINCKLSNDCWKLNTKRTVQGFEELEARVRVNGQVTNSDLSECLNSCNNTEKVIDSFNEIYKEKVYEQANNIRLNELREVITGQLSTMEDVLCDLSYRVSQMSYVDATLSKKVKVATQKLGLKNAKVCVYCDEQKSYRVEMYIPANFKIDIVRLTILVGEILSMEMELPQIQTTEAISKLSFSPKAEYELRVGYWQSSANKDIYCGDTMEIIPLSTNEEYILLSDGMGTGKRAKLDSLLASSLAGKLVKTGVSCETAIRMINSILRVKGWEESFATLDIARFDLYRGVCDIIKAGAAPSYLIRDEVISKISLDTLPLGILTETDIASQRMKLFDNDIIILASDGISDFAEQSISSIIGQGDLPCDILARKIADAFFEISNSYRRDDVSIIVIKMCYSAA